MTVVRSFLTRRRWARITLTALWEHLPCIPWRLRPLVVAALLWQLTRDLWRWETRREELVREIFWNPVDPTIFNLLTEAGRPGGPKQTQA